MVKNVSGRVWKKPGNKVSSLISATNPVKIGWESRKALEKAKMLTKQLERDEKEKSRVEKEEERKRKEVQIKNRIENQLKNEIRQSVDANKVKRMKKKQLRAIRLNN